MIARCLIICVRKTALDPCVVWTTQPRMEDPSNRSAPQTAGEEASSSGGHQPAVRRVAAVSSPALSAARLSLPGVMDTEGRVDESRLRMHIFKNGFYLSIYQCMHISMKWWNVYLHNGNIVVIYLIFCIGCGTWIPLSRCVNKLI